LIVESSRFPRYHVGESLIPQTFATLQRVGLLPKLRESHFPEKHSVRFVTPSGEAAEPFYFSETIEGDAARTWQVERSEFDSMCLEHARDNGVEVRMATRVESVQFEADRAVGVRTRSGGAADQIRSQVVVDASGRATVIGSQLGLRQPIPDLKKASLWSYYRGGLRGQGIDAGETTIFTTPQRQWFWYIPLPDDCVSVGTVAPSNHLFGQAEDMETVFRREVGNCAPLARRLRQATQIPGIRGIRRLAYRNRQTVGDGWVMVGDAAAFLDPIYSSGLFLALASAEMAADCIHDALVLGDPSAERLAGFVPPLARGVEVIRRLIHAFYDPRFSFQEFVKRFPQQRRALIDCLVGDVIGKDLSSFLQSLTEAATPPPPPACQRSDQAVAE
jgi:flavin-dependent dehydrogenase